jgi:leucyl-tRNA synthetase
MNNRDAMEEITKLAEKKKWGKRTVNFKLKEWLISRQRYWGTPIPIIYCDKCGMVSVPYDELPVKLPKNVKFTGKGNPLETSKEFVNVKCPKCNGKARRETDTMDTFVDSSWYFLRYCSPSYEKAPFDKKAVKYWMPVDQYIGGIEHACMHLIYARFFTKALRDLKMHDIDEPFSRLLCQGMVLKDGEVMSKSKGNVVDPREIIEKYGADTARTFILFVALPEKELEWSDEGVAGVNRFLNRVYGLLEKPKFSSSTSDRDKVIIGKMHRVIERVSSMIDEFKLSLAIGAIMEYVNDLYRYREKEVNEKTYNEAVKNLALLICPFAPHLAEEMWEKLNGKGFISLAKWPEYDESKIDLKAEAGEEMLHNTISDINSVLKLLKIEKPSRITLFAADKWKYEFFVNLKKVLDETRNTGEIIKKVMIKEHGKEISSLVPRLVKDITKIPSTVTSQDYELKVLKENMDFLINEFKAPVAILKAEESKEAKARNAMPGKPAILVQ